MTDQPASLAEALALLQTQLPRIGKDKTATVTSQRTGKTHKYDYANLATVSEKILPLLGNLGLSFTCSPTIIPTPTGHIYGSGEIPSPPAGTLILEYVLRHAGSNDKIVGYYPLPQSGSPQEIGSAITYARRYCLCAVTGVAPDDDDDDALAAEEAARKPPRTRPPARPAGELPRNTDGSVSRSRTTDAELDATGQMTDAQIRDHGRLQRDVQGTGPQGTTRLTATPEDDLFYDSAEGRPFPIAPLQSPRPSNVAGVIHREFARLGFTDDQRDARLKIMSQITGRDITSTNDLTAAEGLDVKRLISACRDQSVLAAKLLERQQEAPDAS